jgi:hypothetical protein
MQATVAVELLSEGLVVDFSKVAKADRAKAQDRFEWIYNDLAGTDIASERDPDHPGVLVYTHVATTVVGVPIPVTKAQAEAIRQHRFEHGKEVDVFDPEGDGEKFFILSDSGSRRVLANVRARYTIAKKLGCSPRIDGDSLCWRGEFTYEFSVE